MAANPSDGQTDEPQDPAGCNRWLEERAAFTIAAIGRVRAGVLSLRKLARRTAIAFVRLIRKLLTAGVSFGRFLWWSIVAAIISQRVRLIVAAVAFIGWMAYLGSAALTKYRGPIVSHAQVAAATHSVVAEVTEIGPDGKPTGRAKVVEPLSPGSPAAGTEIFVVNLAESRGFEQPGQYLLLLTPNPFVVRNNLDVADLPPFALVGQQRSPGNDLTGVGKPAIYPWTDDVRKQFEKMKR